MKNFIFFFFTFLLINSFDSYSAQENWEKIFTQDGIDIFKQDVPGTSVLRFKGQGILNQDILSIFAVLFEPDRKKEFIENCEEFQVLRVMDKDTSIAYTRIGSPFVFISNRDIVMKSKIQFDNNLKTITAFFSEMNNFDKKVPKGTVRMKTLRGKWVLKSLSDNKTHVTYEVESDPGGLLPKWLVNLASKRLPFKTIKKLEQQASRDKVFDEAKVLAKYMFNFSGLLSKNHFANTKSSKEAKLVKSQFNQRMNELCGKGIKYACDMKYNVKLRF